jgi:hypothetical protein
LDEIEHLVLKKGFMGFGEMAKRAKCLASYLSFISIYELPDILKEIQNGNLLNWSILYLYATGHLGEGKSIPFKKL